jgi:hypothetical protein
MLSPECKAVQCTYQYEQDISFRLITDEIRTALYSLFILVHGHHNHWAYIEHLSHETSSGN